MPHASSNDKPGNNYYLPVVNSSLPPTSVGDIALQFSGKQGNSSPNDTINPNLDYQETADGLPPGVHMQTSYRQALAPQQHTDSGNMKA